MRARVLVLALVVLALTPAAAAADVAHVVKPGETLTSIARVDGLTVAALAHANGISPMAELVAGQTLWIPPRTGGSAAAASKATTLKSAPSKSPAPAGDGGSAIVPVTPSTAAPTQSQSPVSAAPYPTDERVSAAEIATIADANGVPAALAEAIAWQESGWNNDEVSKIGAVGVMQVTPATWSWIDSYLTPTDPLGTSSASENVRAGVLLLHQLLGATGNNQRLAAGAYFQGLASIQKFGMFASTRRYVANVEAIARRLSA